VHRAIHSNFSCASVATCGVAIGLFFLTGCAQQMVASPPQMPSADEALALAGRVLDCELKAANRYDNGHSSITDVAESVMAACYGEIAGWDSHPLESAAFHGAHPKRSFPGHLVGLRVPRGHRARLENKVGSISPRRPTWTRRASSVDLRQSLRPT
jgi:hypothetical protein